MVEVIVSIAILGVSFLAVFGALRACGMAGHHTRMLTGSVLLAESLLTEAKLERVTAFETTKGQRHRYEWQVQVAATEIENLGAICVRVSWNEQQRLQYYELVSLVLMEPLLETE